ncbi:MAG: DUF1122 domain-containing protein [Proteobacteria bacterium]|nr:DUF1122 domain-containing protein [Pseudomonadota bacterium]
MVEPLDLSDLDGLTVSDYQIQTELEPLRYRQGWTHFSIYLKDQDGRLTSQMSPAGEYVRSPVLEGIHSRGGKWVKGWIEVGDYFPVVYLGGGKVRSVCLNLSEAGVDREIFQFLSDLIPPGGHLMFAYEVSYKSNLHRETQVSLVKGIPPVCTDQGMLLFHTGFRLVKDWYLAEGGHEGPRKLWGEKPSNESEARRFDLMTFFQLLGFLSRRPNLASIALEMKGREKALEVLGDLNVPPPLPGLVAEVIRIQQNCLRDGDLEKANRRTCRELGRFTKMPDLRDGNVKGKLFEISKACSERWLAYGT